MAPTNSRNVEREHDRLALLADFGRYALQHGNLTTLFQRACDLASRALETERSKILRYRPETADLLLVAGIGWAEGTIGHAVLNTDIASPPGRALQTSASVAIEDFAKTDGYRHSKLLRDHGVRALINVPIITDGLNWGVFEVDSTEVRKFSAADESFLLIFAHLIGAAVLRSRGMDTERKSAERAAADQTRRDLLIRELFCRKEDVPARAGS